MSNQPYEGVVVYPPEGGLVARVTVGGETVERRFTADEVKYATRLQWVAITVGASSADPNAKVTQVDLVAHGWQPRRAESGQYQKASWRRIWRIWPPMVEPEDVPAIRQEVEGFLRGLMRGEEGER